jgi:hypothetical protein
MTNFTSHARRAGAVAAAAGAAIALASPASADEILISDKHIGIDNCAAVGSGQFCPAKIGGQTQSQTGTQIDGAQNKSIKVEFTANQAHCSDIIAHVFVSSPGNVAEWGSNIVHPGGTDGGYEIPLNDSFFHRIDIQAEGVPGGCNTGSVSSWGGELRISQLT